MIPIEFIRLERPEKARYCCLLAEDFFSEGKRVQIVVKDTEQGKVLDQFMWTWRKTSFVPHVFWQGEEDNVAAPVLITTEPSHDFDASVLIMAAPCPLEFIHRFEQACDFAELYDPVLHEKSRQRFILYRENGFEPRMRQ